MSKQWPQFITRDLGQSAEDDLERDRRWTLYTVEMQRIIAAGGVHQDDDGWWVDDATGELIGPDPELERPLTDAELATMRPLSEVDPNLAEQLKRARGRPASSNPKRQLTLRLDAEVIERLRASGPGWQTRINEVLKKVVGL